METRGEVCSPWQNTERIRREREASLLALFCLYWYLPSSWECLTGDSLRMPLQREVMYPMYAHALLHVIKLFAGSIDGNPGLDWWVTSVRITALLRGSFCWLHTPHLSPHASKHLEAVVRGTAQGSAFREELPFAM